MMQYVIFHYILQAIRDSVIEARIDHNQGYMQSKVGDLRALYSACYMYIQSHVHVKNFCYMLHACR